MGKISKSSVIIKTIKSKVWKAITDPDFVKQWQYGSQLFTDWKVGSSIVFRTEWEGQIFEQHGKILEIQENEYVIYDLFAPRPGLEDKPENYFIMKYILKEHGNETELEIVQEDNRNVEGQDDSTQETEEAENSILNELRKVAEKI
jgi:uncharacterized protein YndB with AHSA1/START domain